MRFRQLFELSVNKLCTVDGMFVLGWVEGWGVAVVVAYVGVGGGDAKRV